jgi:hypothetical protein
MHSNGVKKTIIAVSCAAFLILCSGAQASNLLGLGVDLTPTAAVERPAGFLDQVASWLVNAWTDLKVSLAEDTTTTPTIQTTCDAGWGLDPEGCPIH